MSSSAAADDPRLVRMFHQFAEHEFRGHSPVYTALARACADDPRLGEPLLAAPPRQRRALLLFAAVQYLLRTAAPGHALAAYLPILGGDRPPDDGLVAAYADLVGAYGDELRELCARRTTQTNEPARAALLRPAFGRAAHLAAGRPLGLIELGPSAGLLLLPDRYGYRYTDGSGQVRQFGRADAPAPLVFDCVLHGGWPPELATEPVIASRAGIDLSPVDAADPQAVQWLRSCVWPEQVDRHARLDAALAEAVALPHRPRLIQGDMVDALPAAVSTVDPAAVPVVFTCHAVTYLPSARQRQLAATLGRIGARRDLVVVLNETADSGARLFSGDVPPPVPGPAVAALTIVYWLDGQATVEVLGGTGPHGAFLSWAPRGYGYRPHTVDDTASAGPGC